MLHRHALPLLLTLQIACGETGEDKADNLAPSIDAVRVTSSTSRVAVGATLTCEATAVDPEGDTLTLSFAWEAGGRPLGASESLELTPGLLTNGDSITCTVTATDPAGASATGTETVAFEDTAPSVTAVRIDPSADITSDTALLCAAEATDADGTAPSLTFAWRNATTGATLGEGDSLLLTPGTASPDDTIACTATASADGQASSAEAQVAVSNRAPRTPTVVVSPEFPASYEDVVCSVTEASDPDGDAVAVHYRWEVDGVPAGEGDTLAAPFAVGATLTCIAELDDGRADGLTLAEASAVVEGTPPELGAVSLPTGPTYNDSTLSCVAPASDVDGDLPTVTYAWTNATRGTALGAGETLALDASLASPEDVIACAATATDAQGMTATGTASTILSNRAPILGAVSIDPATPTAADTLTCAAASAHDPDGEVVTLTYAWTVDGALAGTGSTLAGGTGRGDAVTCTVTATDPHGEVTTSAATTSIADSAPEVLSVSLSPTAPDVTSDIVAVVDAYDLDGDAVSLVYVWTVDGVEVQSGASDTLPAGTAARGERVEVTVTPADDVLTGASASATLEVGNAAASVLSVALAPEAAATNDVLTATVATVDPDGDTVSLTYTWYVDGVAVASGPDATLDGAEWFDKDATVYVVVAADDGTTVTETTSVSVVIANTSPTAPVVAITPGEATEGDDLTCSVVSASSDADGDAVTYAFAWTVDGVAYEGATDGTTSSVVDGSEVRSGEVWECTVVANDGDASGTAASTASASLTVTDVCYDSATYTVTSTSRSERETVNAAAKDIDRDGYIDLMFVNQLSSSVTIWWGGSSGVHTAETTLSMGRVGYGVDAGDINGDGYAEIVASNQDYNQYYVAWGSGPRTFSGTSTVSQSGFPQGVTLTDADRDGDLDLVSTLGSGWAGVSGGNCTITRLNNGTGTFAAGGCWTTDTNQKRAADLDGDGYDELIGSGTAVVYSSRSGTWTASGSVPLGSVSTGNQIYPYDADEDGDIDLVIADGTDASLTTFRNDGTGTFSQCDDSGPLSYWPYGVGDLDADGDLDFVSVSTCGYCASTWRVGAMN